MIFRRLMIALFVASMIPLLWFDADAQASVCTNWRSIGGSQTCVRWVPGSEDCIMNSTGGALTNSTARCEVDPPEGDTITGTLVCIPAPPSLFTLTPAENQKQKDKEKECKDHEFNGEGVGHDHHDDDCIVTPNVTIDSNDVNFPLFAQTGDGGVQCDRKGNCKTRLSVNILQEDGNAICSNQLDGSFIFVNFTANKFLGTARICEGGNFVDSEGVFCDNSEGSELFQQQLCTISENGQTYNCVEVVD